MTIRISSLITKIPQTLAAKIIDPIRTATKSYHFLSKSSSEHLMIDFWASDGNKTEIQVNPMAVMDWLLPFNCDDRKDLFLSYC